MQIDWWTLAIQTINFLVVIWFLSRFLYRPIRRIIEEREALTGKAVADANAKVEAAEAERQKYETMRAELAESQRKREADLHVAMEKERKAALDTAAKEASDLIADARAKIEKERGQALEKLNDDLADLARDLAAKALTEVVGDPLDRVTKHLDGLPKSDRADLLAELSEADGSLRVETTAPFSDGDQDRWKAALSKRFGKTVAVSFKTVPELLGGVELHFPHAVLSFSVADRIRRAAKGMKG